MDNITVNNSPLDNEENLSSGDELKNNDNNESIKEVATKELDPEFILSEKHNNLIKKYLYKSEQYLDELDNEMRTEIDIETETLNRMIDTPVFKK